MPWAHQLIVLIAPWARKEGWELPSSTSVHVQGSENGENFERVQTVRVRDPEAAFPCAAFRIKSMLLSTSLHFRKTPRRVSSWRLSYRDSNWAAHSSTITFFSWNGRGSTGGPAVNLDKGFCRLVLALQLACTFPCLTPVIQQTCRCCLSILTLEWMHGSRQPTV